MQLQIERDFYQVIMKYEFTWSKRMFGAEEDCKQSKQLKKITLLSSRDALHRKGDRMNCADDTRFDGGQHTLTEACNAIGHAQRVHVASATNAFLHHVAAKGNVG